MNTIKLERINERATLVDDSFYPYQTEALILIVDRD